MKRISFPPLVLPLKFDGDALTNQKERGMTPYSNSIPTAGQRTRNSIGFGMKLTPLKLISLIERCQCSLSKSALTTADLLGWYSTPRTAWRYGGNISRAYVPIKPRYGLKYFLPTLENSTSIRSGVRVLKSQD